MASPLPFLDLIERLKNIPRSGWVRRNVPSPESVSDHMYRMAVICWMIPNIDEATRSRAVYMALAHDMGESIIGDITPFDGIAPEEKYLQEELALKYLACTIRPINSQFADMILSLWLEFEEGKSEAARLVREVDEWECMHQAMIYEERSHGIVDLTDFFATDNKLQNLHGWNNLLLQEWSSVRARKNDNVLIIFVLGGPGAGKGTQCERAARDFNLDHISVGDLLRDEAQSSTSIYKDFINESIQKSVIIPAQLTTALIKQRMHKASMERKSGFLLDGFPRSVEQAVDFELKISARNFIMMFNCSEDVMVERLMTRAKSSGRIDDNPDSIKKRIETFRTKNEKVIEHLQKNSLINPVECVGSIDEVYASVRTLIQDIITMSSR